MILTPVDVGCPVCGAEPRRYCPFPFPGVYAGTYDFTHLERRVTSRRLARRLFRTVFVLMALGQYGYGDHVTDPRAFGLRLRGLLRRSG